MKTELKQAVCAIVRQGDLFLGVTRKDNHADWGLVGGKVEDDDPTLEFAAIRETKEETGYDLVNLKLLDTREWGGYQQHCYLADVRGRINFNREKETHLVEWISADQLLAGSFGEYNGEVMRQHGII